MRDQPDKTPNDLINESSPYLLQHAYNPVNWLPFGDKAFEMARAENKPLLISIGYSACHWCHVMEHESFEDDEVARIMNGHFINVKVDREERPDVDMLYMQAVQLMTGRGGWPLNCFVLPDGRPFYGGTYFKKAQWLNVLQNLSDIYRNDPGKVLEYAGKLTEGIVQAELITTTPKKSAGLSRELLDKMVEKWKQRLDQQDGGPNHAPKFPLPSNYTFLLRYAQLAGDRELLDHVNLTLTKMAFGGIYDQLHGGFARYSTDMLWKVPHFEKMLYDNSQLASLYCEAYTITGNSLYREIVSETLGFIKREWQGPEGNFYSALDADSDGEEGKYYVWRKEDLQELLGEHYPVFEGYYEINERGYWEHGNYILMRKPDLAAFQADSGLKMEEINSRIADCKRILATEVKSRIKPGLDDKTLTSWNAMTCSAFARAYLSFGNVEYRQTALSSINFISTRLRGADGRLYRTYKNGKPAIGAFLEDYAFTIEAYINCYLITQSEHHLEQAAALTDLCLEEFNNPSGPMLYFTGIRSSQLVARTSETSDNVIPASNSQMAVNLYYLGTYFGKSEWVERAGKMLETILPEMQEYGAGYSNWASLALRFVYPGREVAIVGNNVDENLLRLWQHAPVNAIFAVHAGSSDLPLLKGRFAEGKTLIYVCENNTCKLPVTSVEEALKQLA